MVKGDISLNSEWLEAASFNFNYKNQNVIEK